MSKKAKTIIAITAVAAVILVIVLALLFNYGNTFSINKVGINIWLSDEIYVIEDKVMGDKKINCVCLNIYMKNDNREETLFYEADYFDKDDMREICFGEYLTRKNGLIDDWLIENHYLTEGDNGSMRIYKEYSSEAEKQQIIKELTRDYKFIVSHRDIIDNDIHHNLTVKSTEIQYLPDKHIEYDDDANMYIRQG